MNEELTTGGALSQIDKVLKGADVDFSTKANVAIELLDSSLNALMGMELISKLSVEVDARTEGGKRYVRSYSLGLKDVEGEDGYLMQVPYLKQSTLEEDE